MRDVCVCVGITQNSTESEFKQSKQTNAGVQLLTVSDVYIAPLLLKPLDSNTFQHTFGINACICLTF